MGLEFIASIMLGAFTSLLRILFEDETFRRFWNSIERNSMLVKILRELGIRPPKAKESFQQRVNELIAKFGEVTIETDTIISELESLVHDKKTLVTELEKEQKLLSKKINQLRASPEFATVQIQSMLVKMDSEQAKESRRSAVRDYFLYILGVVSPFLLNWLGNLFGIQIFAP